MPSCIVYMFLLNIIYTCRIKNVVYTCGCWNSTHDCMYVAIICTYIFLGCVVYMYSFGDDGMYTTIMVTQDKATHHILNGTCTQSKCTHAYM
jgi:hypothetical protein